MTHQTQVYLSKNIRCSRGSCPILNHQGPANKWNNDSTIWVRPSRNAALFIGTTLQSSNSNNQLEFSGKEPGFLYACCTIFLLPSNIELRKVAEYLNTQFNFNMPALWRRPTHLKVWLTYQSSHRLEIYHPMCGILSCCLLKAKIKNVHATR